MNRAGLTFDWNRTRAFLVTAETGSLSAAARALGTSQPTLGRQVAALEEALGVALFARTGRGLALTEAGLALLEPARAMGEAAHRMGLIAEGRAEAIEGTITLTASEIYAAHVLPPVLVKLRQDAPGITIEVVASNDTVNLRRREADIALRNARPAQPDLIAKKLGTDRARLYATPGYLKSIGNPKTPETLSQRAAFIAFDNGPRMRDGLNALGLSLTQANFPILTANHLVHWNYVRKGLAIGIVPETLGDADPAVTRALPALAPIEFDAWLITHEELRTNQRNRLVFDTMAKILAPRFRPAKSAP
ncbi:MAG: LysR family transcriptional regulator [Pseudomonadota bacterium]